MKLTYQLESGMLPVSREEQDIVRFMKELAINILNTPEYEDRTIHFETEEANAEVTLCVSASDPALNISVADNGKGIELEAAERLFDRYYRGTSTQQRPEGSGLGLAIAKSIIELHGGTISVSSAPNKGTVFYIGFPHS